MKEISLLIPVKRSLSIIETATAKDREILTFIKSGLDDLKRLGVGTENKNEKEMIQQCVILYVKGMYGNVEIKDKNYYFETYRKIAGEIALRNKFNGRVNND